MGNLALLRPDLLTEWDYEKNIKKPEEYNVNSSKPANWICNKGHGYEAIIVNRTKKGNGCPYCSGRRPIEGETDLLSQRPDIAKDWDFEANKKGPNEYSVFSNIKVRWRCPKGHHYDIEISNRTRGGAGCPYCSGRRPIKGETDLLKLYPDIAAEWDYDKNAKGPDEYRPGSGANIHWKCHKGHQYPAKIYSRVGNGTGCPYCSGRLPIQGETDLLSQRPDIARDWDYEKNKKGPEEYTVFSNKPVHWKCANGHCYPAKIITRTRQNTGCPYCSGMNWRRGTLHAF